MEIKYSNKDGVYIVGETKYTKEEFIDYIDADMLQSALKKEKGSIEIKSSNSQENIGDELGVATNLEFDIPFSRNLIFFGAPGTGKSFQLNKEAKLYFGNNYERVTFHPNYMYGSFVGTYKPAMNDVNNELNSEIKEIIHILNDTRKTGQEKYDILYETFKDNKSLTTLPILLGLYTDDDFKIKREDGTYSKSTVEKNYGRAIRNYVSIIPEKNREEKIVYKYVPGPFMRVYVDAVRSLRSNNPEPYLLVIEEINRANVAAVFGDVFQLLDRNNSGESEYPIQISEDVKNYFVEELGGTPENYSTIRIPSNMYIWATMNSADQGVLPMDTAFRRRWDFKYLGINDATDENFEEFNKYKFKINSSETVLWDEFRRKLNEELSKLNIPEDKLIGPYFISKSVLEDEDITKVTETIKNKVLMYLYEDAAKAYRSSLFAENKHSTYSELCKYFDENALNIFKNKLEVATENISKVEINEDVDITE